MGALRPVLFGLTLAALSLVAWESLRYLLLPQQTFAVSNCPTEGSTGSLLVHMRTGLPCS